MGKVRRFSVSLEEKLVRKFDRYVRKKKYPTRSKAIADLIRDAFVKEEWAEGREVAGAIILLYNHHKRELVDRLTDIQHDFQEIILSTQHIHLDRENCLEIVAVKGEPSRIQDLANRLKGTKGVKHSSFAITATGREV